jgi:hypothetical protein
MAKNDPCGKCCIYDECPYRRRVAVEKWPPCAHRLARDKARLERLVITVVDHAGCGPWSRTCKALDDVRTAAVRIAKRRAG